MGSEGKRYPCTSCPTGTYGAHDHAGNWFAPQTLCPQCLAAWCEDALSSEAGERYDQ